MTIKSHEAPETLPIPSAQIGQSDWAYLKDQFSDLRENYNRARVFSEDDFIGLTAPVFGPITGMTALRYFQGSVGRFGDITSQPQTMASTYPLLAALEEIRMDVERQGAAVTTLGKQFTCLAEEVHELRGSSHSQDREVSEGFAPKTIENALASMSLDSADEGQTAMWLNAAADAGWTSDRAVILAEESLISSNAQARAAAARVLAISSSPRAEKLLRKAAKDETNKLAKAVIESALRAMSAE